MAATTPSMRDPTFLNYTPSQAAYYASHRPTSYAAKLYETIMDHHASTGGQFHRAVDVGCGPGNATRDVARWFEEVIGTDGSEGMIDIARKTQAEEDIPKGAGDVPKAKVRFEVASAEQIDEIKSVDEGSVDLIVAAMAAHWFDMDVFWKKAAKMLKPGGTVALWTVSSLYVHPSMPNAAELQRILFEVERETLSPFELPANRISRDMYDNLALPWTISQPVNSFSEKSFLRIGWNRDGKVDGGESFMCGQNEQTLEKLESSLGTSSMVTRWREANPELVASDKDCVKSTIAKLRRALPEGRETLTTGGATALLMFKKL